MVGSSPAIAAALACLLAAAPVLAQPAPKDRRKAEGLVKQAIVKSQGGDHAGAIALYLEAYAIVPLASLLSNVGTEYQADGKPVEALKYFCMYLEKEPTGPLASYATGQAGAIEADLGDQDTATVCRPIVTKPVETAPAVTTPVTPPTNVDRTSPPAEGGNKFRFAAIVTGVAGVANLGLGVVFGIKARSASNELTNHPLGEPWPEDIQDIEARGDRYENMQIATLIVGGALIATSVSLYVIGSTKSSPINVTPTVTPEGGSVSISGSF